MEDLDPILKALVYKEEMRQNEELCLIASENIVSKAVMKCAGSILTNKYAEGYPGKRYYAGNQIVDEIENYAKEKAKELFNCQYVNVQPHSGSQANQAVYLALCNPGDTILGMDLNAGGHLTHGSKVSASGKLYSAVSYGLDENGYLNYEEIKEKLYQYHPRLLIVGASAYPRIIDFERIRKIVDEYNKSISSFNIEFIGFDNSAKEISLNLTASNQHYCYLMVDMAHIAGLVAAGIHPSPLPYADVVTSTTHKTLRGPRGGFILTNNEEIVKKIDKAVFPGIQGGPLVHIIAAKAQCFVEALTPSFITYQEQVIKNIKAMEEVFNLENIKMISGGSDNHLLLLDLRNYNITGDVVEKRLEDLKITVNKNAIFGDTTPKSQTSGIRIGTANITSRGLKTKECKYLAKIISKVIKGKIKESELKEIKENIKEITEKHPCIQI